jgi:hypothetical protein
MSSEQAKDLQIGELFVLKENQHNNWIWIVAYVLAPQKILVLTKYNEWETHTIDSFGPPISIDAYERIKP